MDEEGDGLISALVFAVGASLANVDDAPLEITHINMVGIFEPMYAI
jgi:hypothetical protein